LISYEFTQQKKIVKPKVKPILTNGKKFNFIIEKITARKIKKPARGLVLI
jgi:hypothetical protein